MGKGSATLINSILPSTIHEQTPLKMTCTKRLSEYGLLMMLCCNYGRDLRMRILFGNKFHLPLCAVSNLTIKENAIMKITTIMILNVKDFFMIFNLMFLEWNGELYVVVTSFLRQNYSIRPIVCNVAPGIGNRCIGAYIMRLWWNFLLHFVALLVAWIVVSLGERLPSLLRNPSSFASAFCSLKMICYKRSFAIVLSNLKILYMYMHVMYNII